MIWLASFPRSGNTFFRIVLHEVYGIESSTFHQEPAYPLDKDYDQYPVVKTHLLPHEIVPADPMIPAVYLLRDGRDCMVSLAHYRKKLIAPRSNLDQNLLDAIDAPAGSFFGGWSEHVRQWRDRASVVVLFEELIADPIRCIERLRPWLPLPAPMSHRLPAFEDLKKQSYCYGSGIQHGFTPADRERWRVNKFRRGRVGAWCDEMPERHHLRFLRLHGRELIRSGYESPEAEGCPAGMSLHVAPKKARPKRRVLIDAHKLTHPYMDGTKRYVSELLEALRPVAEAREEDWQMDVALSGGHVLGLLEPAMTKLLKRVTQPAFTTKLAMSMLRMTKRKVGGVLSRLLGPRFYEKSRQAYQAVKQGSRTWPGHHDVLHLTLPSTWAFYRSFPGRRITTVHDLAHVYCPELQSLQNNSTLRAGLSEATRSADNRFIAVSSATKEQMVQHLGVDRDQITVVHHASADRFRPIVRPRDLNHVRQRYRLPRGPFILALGTREPRKNLINTIRAFDRLTAEEPGRDAWLVIAGPPGWQAKSDLRNAAKNPRIRFIGEVAEADLPAVYSLATLVSYVSFYEGFGLPLLEAMSCGTPVVYGDTSAMPGIVGPAGLPAHPQDSWQIMHCYRRLLSDDSLRSELARRAVLRSLEFNTRAFAEQTLACYERCGEPVVEHSTRAVDLAS